MDSFKRTVSFGKWPQSDFVTCCEFPGIWAVGVPSCLSSSCLQRAVWGFGLSWIECSCRTWWWVLPVDSCVGEIRPEAVMWLELYFSISSANSLLKDTWTHHSALFQIHFSKTLVITSNPVLVVKLKELRTFDFNSHVKNIKELLITAKPVWMSMQFISQAWI